VLDYLPTDGADATDADALDRAAVFRALAGAQDAFAEIYARNAPAVRRMAPRYLHRAEEREDFVQEVFLKAFSALRSYRGTGPLGAWINRIAVTTGINARARALPEEPLSPAVLSSTLAARAAAEPDALCVARELMGAVRAAVSELPRRYAAAIEERYLSRTPYQQTSELTGVPVGTLKARLHRGKALLRRALEGRGIHGPFAAPV
jgi:RNA polymerase sigma-70 factor (ECF subfamily)